MLNRDFRDMLSELSAAKADYLIVGAYALAAHGLPRATGDLDIWVRPTRDNAERVLTAIERFGAPLEQISLEDLTTLGTVFQIGVAPRRIDVLTSIDAVQFDQAWANRIEAEIDGMRVPILSRQDFLTNKKALGRAKDLADVAWLEGQDEG
jgi:hypothetical protein